MSDSKKKRLSMLDTLATAASPAPPQRAPEVKSSMMGSNRALRSARDAVDSHHIWDLDPNDIDDGRVTDRLDPADVADLRDAIDANGQTVPILVRRHPEDETRYLLVYGRRRLEAIRDSDKVHKIRALVATLDEDAATRAQISENMARRDLSFIERALFAHELLQSGFGTQSQIADVFTVTKSSVSMALAIIEMVTPDLARAIGPAHGIGRPRWEALAKAIETAPISPAALIDLAGDTQTEVITARVRGEDTQTDPSSAAFDAVMARVQPREQPRKAFKEKGKPRLRPLHADGQHLGNMRKSSNGLRFDIDEGGFADWLESRADTILQDLHARWKSRAEE